MPTIVRMDRGDVDELVEWLRDRIADAERAAGDDQDALDVAAAHRAILGGITPHLRAHGTVGQLADGTLQRLGLAYQHHDGYREGWRP